MSATETKGECFESVGATTGQNERADKTEVLSRQIRQLLEELEKLRAPRRSKQRSPGSKAVYCAGRVEVRDIFGVTARRGKSNGILVPKKASSLSMETGDKKLHYSYKVVHNYLGKVSRTSYEDAIRYRVSRHINQTRRMGENNQLWTTLPA